MYTLPFLLERNAIGINRVNNVCHPKIENKTKNNNKKKTVKQFNKVYGATATDRAFLLSNVLS